MTMATTQVVLFSLQYIAGNSFKSYDLLYSPEHNVLIRRYGRIGATGQVVRQASTYDSVLSLLRSKLDKGYISTVYGATAEIEDEEAFTGAVPQPVRVTWLIDRILDPARDAVLARLGAGAPGTPTHLYAIAMANDPDTPASRAAMRTLLHTADCRTMGRWVLLCSDDQAQSLLKTYYGDALIVQSAELAHPTEAHDPHFIKLLESAFDQGAHVELRDAVLVTRTLAE
jgi:predicted DNA-binding WGR domain protein